MYTVIKNYCSNEIENGLLLLDMPTGFGKTYNVLKYIYEASMEAANAERKFFFVTTLKKNLPKEDLEKHFRSGGHLVEFKDMLAYNYMQCREEHRKPGEDEFSLESAIRSILAEFRLSDKHIDYITSQILISSYKPKGDMENADFDLSFYENGFRYYAFEDDYAHDMLRVLMLPLSFGSYLRHVKSMRVLLNG